MDTAAPDCLVRHNLTYAVHDGVELQGDLYLPHGVGPFPVVVGATGGGWQQCDRGAFAGWGRHLARHGIALFSISYRTAAKRKMFPEAVHDVLAAVRFVRGEASELALDPDRIALLGSSAGAHLASLAALAGESPAFRNIYPGDRHAAVSTAVKALVPVYGIFDMFSHWQDEIATTPSAVDTRAQRFMGVSPFEDRRLYFDASPASYVSHATNRMAVFLVHGTADDAVSIKTQSEPFLRILRCAGFNARACVVPGAPHFWFSDEPIDEPGSFPSFVAPRLVRFLRRNL